MERITEESCESARRQGWKMRWEWRGDSMWIIDETQQSPIETEMFDVVPIDQAMRELEPEGGTQ
jgi:hypothetical protein